MVRLLRIVTDDENGFFENEFNTDIKLEAGQQIALQSASFTGEFSSLIIDGVNDDIEFQYATGKSATIKLNHGTFNNTNFGDLFSDMTRKLNKALVYQAGKTLGLTFLAEIATTTRKTEIGYLRSNFVSNNNRVTNYGNLSEYVNLRFTGGRYSKPDGAAATTNDNAKYFSNVPWSQGCMVHRLRIVSYVDNGGGATENQGLILGLSNVEPSTWANNDVMTDDEKTYYIKFNRDNTPYQYKVKGGANVITAIVPHKVNNVTRTNDMIEIVRNGDKIEGYVYRDSQAAAEQLFSVVQTDDEELYPFVTVQGATGDIKFNRASHTIDPYHPNHTILDESTVEDVAFGANPPPDYRGGGRATVNILTLQETLSAFCGFRSPVNNLTEINANFVADKIFVGVTANDNFLVELMSLQINSYNSDLKGGSRRNIIGVIPSNNSISNNVVEYEPNNLYYVDIAQETTLRNLSARILRIDGSRPNLQGLSVLVFLIK